MSSGFGIDNLPYGAFSTPDAPDDVRLGVAFEGSVIDLRELGRRGALGREGELVQGPTLQPLVAAGAPAWADVRGAVRAAVERGEGLEAAVSMDAVQMHLAFEPGDYVDFYSSIEHATNLGRILRPDGEPLLPNWRHLPVGYHGRSATVVVSGTAVRRPQGQRKAPDSADPSFGPSLMLDFELEVGFVTGGGPALGHPIAVDDAEGHIFGLVLVNDWSARDIQSWEYQPLGPFLAKSFATSVSPWVVPLDALRPFRIDGPVQVPTPLPYLRAPEPRGLDLALEVTLRTAAMAADGLPPAVISSTSFSDMYWSMSQQLAHLTVNGASIRPGDLCASGTVSGSKDGSEGSLMELTWRGTRPLSLPNGEQRSFLEDGDEVVLLGRCVGPGSPVVDFGHVVGVVEPAR